VRPPWRSYPTFAYIRPVPRISRAKRHHLTSDGIPKIGYDCAEAALERVESHFLEGSTNMRAYSCETCGLWHLGNPIRIRRKYPIVHRETLVLELGDRAAACLWDETYRDDRGRAYHVRKTARSALGRSNQLLDPTGNTRM
jgi:hypothetical protein